MGGPIGIEWKRYESIRCYTYFMTLSYDLDLSIFKVKLWKCYIYISGMGGPVDMEPKG